MCGVGDLYCAERNEGLCCCGLGGEAEVCRGVVNPFDAIKGAGGEMFPDIRLDIFGVESVKAANVYFCRDELSLLC